MDPRPPSAGIDAGERRDFEKVEKRFFEDLKATQRVEDDRLEYEFETTKAQITVKLEEALREKAMLERKLQDVQVRIVSDNERLEKLTEDYKVKLAKLATSRRKAYYDMQDHFKKNREEGPLNTDLILQMQNTHMATIPGEVVVDGDDDLTGVSVYHSDGHFVGPVRRVALGSSRVDVLLDLPVKRDVYIRPGRKFNAVNLEPIYSEAKNAKLSKWVAFMVQAVGDIQSSPCTNCAKPGGLFSECIKVHGDLFGRCGNCEWSKQACHPVPVIADSQETAVTLDVEMRDVSAAPAPPVVEFRRSEDMDSRQPLILKKAPIASQKKVIAPKSLASREIRPGPLALAAAEPTVSHRPLAPAPPRSERTAPAEENPESRTKSPAGSANTSEYDPVERENLMNPPISLRHNGVVYTYPDLVADVPLEKIDENHAYWDPAWKDPVLVTKSVLAGYKDKHEASLSDVSGARPSHAKFLLGRQVKRGYVILDFLESGPFHPYQFVAKKWMSPGIITYDTLYRLAATLEELERFKIKVSPADWLRQRFYEIMLAEGDQFNLTKTLKDFYHDPKLKALRGLSGFGNIGRPSGAKGGAEGSSKSPKSERQRRKDSAASGNAPSGGAARPAKRPKIAAAPPQQAPAPPAPEPAQEPALPDQISVVVAAAAEDEFAFDGFTDTDSLCGDSVDNDDYKVQQVRTRQHTTPVEGAQYWHFIQHYDDLGTWELHLLQRKDPPDWVRYEPPFNFGVFLDEIAAVTYHPESLKIHVKLTVPEDGEGTAGYVKGEVMTWFKRERTKRRLLSSCREKAIALKLAESAEFLEKKWEELGGKSHQLSGVLETNGDND
ncbi:hypothetical protein jhhlp_000130 [Lomentospora prolificans]|uniref:Uncharacterized protein n=1 Tax=Lomentospora prolificans TaxID=41688 RepID=A0A2N3NLR1_9PEZI|nr:hypothetical protein jhhlp_000130 [Lomentospora prolificans]